MHEQCTVSTIAKGRIAALELCTASGVCLAHLVLCWGARGRICKRRFPRQFVQFLIDNVQISVLARVVCSRIADHLYAAVPTGVVSPVARFQLEIMTLVHEAPSDLDMGIGSRASCNPRTFPPPWSGRNCYKRSVVVSRL